MSSFFVLQGRALTADRFYKVYVTDRGLSFAWIAGQFWDRRIAIQQLQQAAFLFSKLVDRRLREREEREAVYDTLDANAPEFLARDRRNFRIDRFDISQLRIRRRWSMHAAGDNVGILDVTLRNNTRRSFVLVRDQSLDEIAAALKRFDSSIEIVGTWTPRERKPADPRKFVRALYFLALLVAAMGAANIAIGLMRPMPPRQAWGYMTWGLLHIPLAIWLMHRARKRATALRSKSATAPPPSHDGL